MSQPSHNDTQLDEERRLVPHLLRYWEKKCAGRTMPQESDIDPEELGADWDYCFLLQSRDIANIQDYNFTYLGKKILEAYHDGRIDAHNESMVGPNAFRLSGQFARVLARQKPVVDQGEFVTLHGHRVRYRQILLPLGAPGHSQVEAIFGGMGYRILPG